MANWLPYPLSFSSWLPPHSKDPTRTGPTASRFTTVAASLRLGHFLRRLLLQGHNLNLVALRSSFEDAWRGKDSQSIRFSFLHSSNDFSAAFSSLLNCFAGIQEGSGDGTEESSSSGMEESLSPGTGQSSSSGMGESSSSGKSRKNLFEGRHWTNILLAINLLVYSAEIATQGKLLPMGAKINKFINQGQWWRLVTASFLHANIGHLMLNCFSLNSVGPTVEYLCGPRRFLAVYFISAVAGTAMSYWKSQSPSLGASGAIFGLVGATTVFVWRHAALTAHGTEDLQHIGYVLLINLAIGLSFKNFIDNWGHLGGLLGGAATSWFLGPAWEIESTTEDGRRILVDKAPVFHLLQIERPHPRNRFF